jgi:hypothetical protein
MGKRKKIIKKPLRSADKIKTKPPALQKAKIYRRKKLFGPSPLPAKV